MCYHILGSIPQQHDHGRGDTGAAMYGGQEGQRWPVSSLRLYQSDWLLW